MNTERTLLSELRLVNIALKRGMNRFCGDCENELPTVASMIVHYIFISGGSALQKDVESEFNLRRSTASRQLGKLEQEGYITREAKESDGRSKRIYLSEKAKAEQSEIIKKFRGVEEYVDTALTVPEKETFYALCDKIRKRLECAENSRGGV